MNRTPQGTRESTLRKESWLWLGLAICFLPAWAGCDGGAEVAVKETVDSLLVDASAIDFSTNPELRERISATPHGYFRFINIRFGQVICADFPDLIRAPQVNLHGDAHIEQYAVTDLGRGLTDFDDSATGPATIDLLRFAVSLRITSRILGWEDEQENLILQFLEGYLESMASTEAKASEPSPVQRLRSAFRDDRNAYFEWVESMMEPLDQGTALGLVEAMQSYVQDMAQQRPELAPDYFRVIQLGGLKLGIGSALDRKYLVRVQGPSRDSLDDEVLEFKQLRNLEGIPCIRAGKDDPFRILTSQIRIAYNPFPLLGYLRFDGLIFWAHSWVQNYQELEIQKSFESPQELAEVARDVGIQLGLGHPKLIASPFDAQLRADLTRFVEEIQDRLLEVTNLLADRTEESWNSFR